jgi:SpoIID/LytB domain protein
MFFYFPDGDNTTGAGTGWNVGMMSGGNVTDNIIATDGKVNVSRSGSDIIYVLGANGIAERRFVNDVHIYGRVFHGQNGGHSIPTHDRLSIVTSSPLVISGVGHGHGVGMPQASAIEMARQGFTFEQILKHFFTDIEIRAYRF